MDLPLNAAVDLVDISGICVPVGTCAVDHITVQNTSSAHHLRLALKELNGKTFRSVPSDVAMQEPGLREETHVSTGSSSTD